MEDIKNKLLQVIPIENYVSRFVSLKKQGRYLIGLCPFHQEKTPSFTITPEKGIFYCFGCGRGGNLITFVMEKENVSFKEAIEILANYAGIKISKSKNQVDNKYFKLLEDLHKNYREFLLSNEGSIYRDYLLKRGVSNDSIIKFQIGASPDNSQWIYNKFREFQEDLLFLGVIKKSEHQYYDFFRNRIIFPIFNTNNEIIGFGARVLDDSKPKYLNSQESSIFHKGSTLYGINFALNAIKKYDFAFITEGYLDVIGLHQIGIENVVAPLGTSFTEEHKKLITRYTKKIVLMMDGDEAGRNSILKTIILLEDYFKDIKVLLLPQDIDAFDFSNILSKNNILWNSSDFLENSIQALDFILLHFIYDEELNLKLNGQSLLDFYKKIKQFIEKQSLNSIFYQKGISQKQTIIDKLKNYILNFRNDFIRNSIIEEISKIIGLDLQNYLKTEQKKQKISNIEEKNLNPNIDSELQIIYIIEREIIGIFLNNPKMINNFSGDIQNINFYDDVSEYIWRIINDKFINLGQNIDIKDVLNFLPPTMQNEVLPYIIKQFYHNKEQSIKTVNEISDNDVINILKELIIKHRIHELNLLIKNKKKDLLFTQNENKTYIYYEINKLLKEKKMLSSSLRGSN